ncbi:MAG: 30S ribosomal protein S6 [Bryobacteraceae bacterium]
MRIYEELFIVKPDAVTEEVDAFIVQVKEIITSAGGTIEKEEKWGTRKLAYRVQKFAEGIYILLQFSAEPSTIFELERRLRVQDMVIKFITVRIDEKMKKIEKRRKHREKRAAKRPPPAAPPPAMPHMPSEPAAVAPGAPAHPMPAAPVPAAPEEAVAPAANVPASPEGGE